MSNVIIYKEERQSLNEIAFVKDTFNQIKIRNVSEYEFLKQIGILFGTLSYAAGIKSEISQFDKTDIKDLILRKYKNLSLDEIAYAFKLERHGDLGERTQHFQLFNSAFVDTILEKYKEWKRSKLAAHNISKKTVAPMISEEEKQELINNAVRKVLKHFLEYKTIKQGYVFVYEELVDSGLLNLSVEEKKEIYKAAQDLLEMEYSEKKATSREERGEIKAVLDNLNTPNEPIVVQKAKEVSMQRFFRELLKDEKSLNEFNEKYSIGE